MRYDPTLHDRVRLTNRELEDTGLLVPYTARLHKLATIEKSLIDLRLGPLSANDRERASYVLRSLWRDWGS